VVNKPLVKPTSKEQTQPQRPTSFVTNNINNTGGVQSSAKRPNMDEIVELREDGSDDEDSLGDRDEDMDTIEKQNQHDREDDDVLNNNIAVDAFNLVNENSWQEQVESLVTENIEDATTFNKIEVLFRDQVRNSDAEMNSIWTNYQKMSHYLSLGMTKGQDYLDLQKARLQTLKDWVNHLNNKIFKVGNTIDPNTAITYVRDYYTMLKKTRVLTLLKTARLKKTKLGAVLKQLDTNILLLTANADNLKDILSAAFGLLTESDQIIVHAQKEMNVIDRDNGVSLQAFYILELADYIEKITSRKAELQKS
jgi:hypothetical protein